MAVDMAIELRKKNVCVVSMWPGAVITELVNEQINNGTKVNYPMRRNYRTYAEKAVTLPK